MNGLTGLTGKYEVNGYGRKVSTYVRTHARTQARSDRPKRSVVRTNKYIRPLEFLSAFGARPWIISTRQARSDRPKHRRLWIIPLAVTYGLRDRPK